MGKEELFEARSGYRLVTVREMTSLNKTKKREPSNLLHQATREISSFPYAIFISFSRY